MPSQSQYVGADAASHARRGGCAVASAAAFGASTITRPSGVATTLQRRHGACPAPGSGAAPSARATAARAPAPATPKRRLVGGRDRVTATLARSTNIASRLRSGSARSAATNARNAVRGRRARAAASPASGPWASCSSTSCAAPGAMRARRRSKAGPCRNDAASGAVEGKGAEAGHRGIRPRRTTGRVAGDEGALELEGVHGVRNGCRRARAQGLRREPGRVAGRHENVLE